MAISKFSMHASDDDAAEAQAGPTFIAPVAGVSLTMSATPVDDLASSRLDPESAARLHLTQAMASPTVHGLTAPGQDSGRRPELKHIGSEPVPALGTTMVKFRQLHDRIPVYGSFVVVELGDQNRLVSIETTMGDDISVDPVATLSPAASASSVRDLEGTDGGAVAGIVPQLNWWFEETSQAWHLAYIFEDVPFDSDDGPPPGGLAVDLGDDEVSVPMPVALERADVVVDAHDGTVLDRVSRTHQAAATERRGHDDLGRLQDFTATDRDGDVILVDLDRRIGTFDFGYGDARHEADRLPGTLVAESAEGFDASAVSAHVNAATVRDFYWSEFQRISPSGPDGHYISSVNCRYGSPHRHVFNAFWDPAAGQMVYGQVVDDDGLERSLAAALDIVAHEITHGVTANTSRLEYANQPGALNESFSDLLGIAIANGLDTDPRTWQWELGGDTGEVLRDLSNPPAHGQPDHQRDFKVLPNTRSGDWGGVHINSGIPNKAGYLMFTATDASDHLVLTPREVATLLYVTLVYKLTRRSDFGDLRRSLEGTAKSQFRNDLARDAKLAAISAALDDVGIN